MLAQAACEGDRYNVIMVRVRSNPPKYQIMRIVNAALPRANPPKANLPNNTLREARRQAPAATPAPPVAPLGGLPRILQTGRCESPGGKPRRRRRLRRRRRVSVVVRRRALRRRRRRRRPRRRCWWNNYTHAECFGGFDRHLCLYTSLSFNVLTLIPVLRSCVRPGQTLQSTTRARS